MDDVGIFYVHLPDFMDTCIFSGYLVYFFPFWYVVLKNFGNPGLQRLQFIYLDQQ
jgi:hypothetical protein